MPSDKKFYLTTPIYYVNARPHIGHAYSTIVADVIARRHRLLGDDTYFLTGTDEHGQKIERSAAAAGIPPQQFADQVSKTFSDLWKRMGITNDDFIRTTSDRHKKGVQKLFADLQANDAIYTDTYTGQYCVSDEAYVEVGPGEPCPDCGNITETISESNYYFKLSAYGERIAARIESNELLIQPDSRRNEILSFVRGGLKDLSISRTSFKWGISVPGDESHVIYVWLDALANYMTAVGYGSDKPEDIAKFERYWPANLHLVGKEIIRFHCVYWPAFLVALRPADSPLSEAEWNKNWLPESIVANGWLLFEESKMSKSRGNVVRTETILDAFGSLCPAIPAVASTDPALLKGTASAVPQPIPTEQSALAAEVPHSSEAPQPPSKAQQDLFATDVLRYFLLREIPFGQDGSFSFDALVQRYNSDLANGYGNLVSRTLKLVETGLDGEFSSVYDFAFVVGPSPIVTETVKQYTWTLGVDKYSGTDELWNASPTLEQAQAQAFDSYNFAQCADLIWQAIRQVDGFLSESAPWKIAKDPSPEAKSRLNAVLYTAAESIRIITALLYPILPYATAQVWSQLGLGDIEAAARNGELKDLKWGGLKPGTKLGPLAPIFPRAPKELIQAMIATEENNAQAAKPTPATEPGAPRLDSETWVSNTEENHPSHHPAAGPRTAISSDDAASHVAGSSALTTERPGTPSHTEAPASAPFANAAAANPDTPQIAPQIAIDDFVKIDLRVAKILVAERIPKADKLLRLEVDLGYEKRQILSGIAEWYQPEELVGRVIAIVANLAPRKMRGFESHGMLLAASHGENGKPVLATFGEDIALGSRLR
jgi:methionyl-tRNA synthetase